MLKRFRYAVLSALLVACLLLVGCVSRDVQAIKNAVLTYGGCYFELDGLSAQVRRQRNKARKPGGETVYQIDVRIPDYRTLQYEDVPLCLPAVDWNNANPSDYHARFLALLQNAAEGYVKEFGCASYIDVSVPFVVFNTAEGRTAEIMPAGKAALLSTVDGLFQDVKKTLSPGLSVFKLIEVASRKEEILCWLFDGEGLYENTYIENLHKLAPGLYGMTLSYPSPTHVYALLAEDLYAVSAGPLFTMPSVNLVPNADYVEPLSELPREHALIRVRYMGGDAVPEDDETVWQAFYEAKTDAEKNVRARIKADFLIPREPLDAPAILSGNDKGMPVTLTMEAHGDETGCCVQFILLSHDVAVACYQDKSALSYAEGTTLLTALVPSGRRMLVHLPEGDYKVELTYGTDWYGADYGFGPGGETRIYPDVLKIESDYTYTLPLALSAEGKAAADLLPAA